MPLLVIKLLQCVLAVSSSPPTSSFSLLCLVHSRIGGALANLSRVVASARRIGTLETNDMHQHTPLVTAVIAVNIYLPIP